MINKTTTTYENWIIELKRIAAKRDILWLVSEDTEAHRDAYDKGLSPGDELDVLEDISEWRGCGCGGGS